MIARNDRKVNIDCCFFTCYYTSMQSNIVNKNLMSDLFKTTIFSNRISVLKNIQNRWNKKKGLLILRDIKKSRAEWK